ncbi:hypothetical protein GBF38_008498, partial [Nibea albiflora]
MPLRHVQICTIKRTLMLIALIWTTTTLSVISDLFITFATEPLDFFHTQVFCLRETAFPSPLIVEKRVITYSVFLVVVWFVIFYTYFRILFTAKTASKDAKKARNTILLHGFQLLLCMAIYAAPQLLDALQKWFPKNFTDSLFAYYIVVQVLPRSISPFIYGIRDNTFRKYLKRILFVAKAADADAKKARNTILLHGFQLLLCMTLWKCIIFILMFSVVNLGFGEMNVSSVNATGIVRYADSFSKAVTKNVIVVVLGISITYINASLIHTFSKHQIFYMNPRYILFIHLVINDMIQVTLTIILFVISYTVYRINVSVCCVFILLALFTT